MPVAMVVIDFGSYPNLTPADVGQARRNISRWMSRQGFEGRTQLQVEMNNLCPRLLGLCLIRNRENLSGSLRPVHGAVGLDLQRLNSKEKVRKVIGRMRFRVLGSPTPQQRMMLRHVLGPDPRRVAR